MRNRILIKIGGRAFQKREGLLELATAMRANENAEFIILHGGGAEISQALEAAGHQNKFIDGIRVTQAEDIKIVEEVLSQKVNRRIADSLSRKDVTCRRMSGKTGNLFIVEPLHRNGHDLGFVGRISKVDATVVNDALVKDSVPVISPISADKNAATYNVNADTAASELAAAAACTDLIFFTDVPGVMVDDKRCATLSGREAAELIEAGVIKGGMVAKIEAALKALKKVARVHILQWCGPQTLSQLVNGQCDSGTIVCS